MKFVKFSKKEVHILTSIIDLIVDDIKLLFGAKEQKKSYLQFQNDGEPFNPTEEMKKCISYIIGQKDIRVILWWGEKELTIEKKI